MSRPPSTRQVGGQHVEAYVAARIGNGFAHPREAIVHGHRRRLVADEGEVAVTQTDQVPGQRAAPGDVVDRDRQAVVAGLGPVHHDDGHTARANLVQALGELVVRHHDEARDALFGEEAKVGLLPFGVAGAVGDQHRQSRAAVVSSTPRAMSVKPGFQASRSRSPTVLE